MTEWPGKTYSIDGRLVYEGKNPATGDYGLNYLNGTSTVGMDFSSIPDFQSFNNVIGTFDGILYLSVYNQVGDILAYSYDGTTLTPVVGLNGDDNDFYSGVEYNGFWYFRQNALRNQGTFADGSDYLFKLQGNTATVVNFGDDANPVAIRNGEPRGTFGGKLYVDGVPDSNHNDRFLLELDANGFHKVTGTIDYQGTPTLRAFSYVDEVFVSGDVMYFGTNYEAPDEFDAYWNGSNGDRGLFKMDANRVVTRLEPTADDPFTGNKTLTSRLEGFQQVGTSVMFQSCIMGTNSCAIYRVSGNTIVYVGAFQGIWLKGGVVFKNKLYFGTGGQYVGTLADSNSQVWAPQLGTLDASGTYTKITGAAGYNRNSSFVLYGNGLLFGKPDADPRTKDELWFTDGTTETKIEGVQDFDFSYSLKVGSKLYFSGISPTDANPDTARLFVVDGVSTPVVVPPTVVDTDNPDLGSLTETKTFKGTKGSIVFPDGSGFDLDAKGRIFSKVKSKYLTSISGTIVATYTAAGKSKSFTCKVKTYGSTKKLSKLPRNAILYKSKQACQLPAAAIASLKLGKLTIVQKITVKRFYATTGLAVDKVTKKKIKPMARKMTIKFTK
ncbi:MAG: hypothetical protein RL488_1130 [Actinomycetota bacterium]